MRFAFALLTLLTTACNGPKFLVAPGGELRGSVASDAIDDWSFTDAAKYLQIETRPEAPYSVQIFGVGSGAAFYIASQGWRAAFGSRGDARWVGHIAADPRIRLRVGEMLYELKAIRVQDEAEVARVRNLFQRKYGSDAEGWGFWKSLRPGELPWVYRLDPR